jgi:lysyl-tRNA synthetase class 1
VNFEPDEKFITKLFNDFDRTHWRTFHDPKVSNEDKRVYHLSEIQADGEYYDVSFPLILALLQLPHLLSLEAEVEKRKGTPLTDIELRQLRRRVASAKLWLERYANEEEKIVLQQTLPAIATELSPSQRAFLHRLATALESAATDEESLQSLVFHIARLTPIDQPRAFQAIYRVLLARDSGPKAGNLLAFLERPFVIERFRELPYSEMDLCRETAIPAADLAAWIHQHRDDIVTVHPTLLVDVDLEVLECRLVMKDAKEHVKRVLIEPADGKRNAHDLFESILKHEGIPAVE